MSEPPRKQLVIDFWNNQPCGEVYAQGKTGREGFEAQARARYALESYLPRFARFSEGRGRDVLEIGVGMGTDHIEWAKSGPRSLAGIDFTTRAVAYTQQRLTIYGLTSQVLVADAEQMPFPDACFDIVYSWGVLHHSPDTRRAVEEVHRVLRPRGCARIMMYHTYSLTGYLLWVRYALLACRPWRTLSDIYAHHLESPGTKAFSEAEAKEMFAAFAQRTIRTQLSFADLLQGEVGQQHSKKLVSLAKRFWPRPIIRHLFSNHGLMLLIEARK